MKYLITLLISVTLQSCIDSSINPPKAEKELVQIWSFDHGIVGDAPPVVSGKIIFASGGLYLFALFEDSGDLIWRTQIDNNNELNGRILLLDDNHVVANHLESIRGWRISDGDLVWDYSHSDSLEPRLNGNHTVTDKEFMFTTYSSKIFALNNEGRLIHQRRMDKNYSIMGIVYEKGKLFLAQRMTVTGALTLGRITCLNYQTGDSLWAFNTDKGGFEVSPIIENGILYASTIGNSPGEIAIALQAETGQEIWRQTNEVYTFNSALGPDHYYINTSGSLAALDKQTGRINWRVEWEGSDFNKPVYMGGYVYHVRDKEMLVIDDKTGEVVYKEGVPDGTYFWHVAASTDKIFAQTSGQLIAYQPWHLKED